MNKKIDLYITFPDELAKGNENIFSLMDKYISTILELITRIYPQNINYAIKGKDFNKENYTDILNNSRAFLFFTHPLFDDITEYETELNDICESLKVEQIDPLVGFPQIFKIGLETLKKPLKNQSLDQLLSHDFFEKTLINRRLRTVASSSSEFSPIIFSKFLDVVYDLIAFLKIEQASSGESNIRYIYLAPTTVELNSNHDEIRRELQHYGFRILPMVNLPLNAVEFEEITLQGLKHSDAIIQLMGTYYGDVVKGSKYSVGELQNKIIKEFLSKDPEKLLKRYIWIPAHSKITDQRQSLFINRVRRDDPGYDTEIIESPIEVFKTILSGRLSSNHEYFNEEYENISKVYLLTEETSAAESEKIYATLSSAGLKVLTLDFSEQIGIYARHLQKLRECDSIIIYQKINNKYWLNSKLRDIIKSPGIGRHRPFKKIVIAPQCEPDENLLKLIRTKIELINDKTFDVDLILHKLISE